MKSLYAVGGLVSLVFAAVGLLFLWKVALFRMDVAICIWALISAFALALTLYVFHLRSRIGSLERDGAPGRQAGERP
jgi:hypothetical protein